NAAAMAKSNAGSSRATQMVSRSVRAVAPSVSASGIGDTPPRRSENLAVATARTVAIGTNIRVSSQVPDAVGGTQGTRIQTVETVMVARAGPEPISRPTSATAGYANRYGRASPTTASSKSVRNPMAATPATIASSQYRMSVERPRARTIDA